MEIDPDMSWSSSSHPLPQALVDEFKARMIETSEHEDWPSRLISADKKKLQIVLFSVLSNHLSVLQRSVITLSKSQARVLVPTLNDDDIEEWKGIVHNGDWVNLITHRSYPQTILQFGDIMPSSSLPLSQALVDEFKTQMIQTSVLEDWSGRLTSAGCDNQKLQKVLFSVLSNYLSIVLQTALQKNIMLSNSQTMELVRSLNDDEIEEWKSIVQNGDWMSLITHPKLQKPAGGLSVDRQAEQIRNIIHNNRRLSKAYTQDFIGSSATQFIEHLEQADIAVETNDEKPLYAKAISVVQSSGTGKSRMLTEVGKQIFTLPICLRQSTDPGYPPGDKPVVDFFSTLTKTNDLSITAHSAIACFLGAAHETMLETLQKAHNEQGLNGPHLLDYWHGLIEPTGERDRRELFFTEVVKRATSMKLGSPPRGDDSKPIPSNFNAFKMSGNFYELYAKKATEKLMEFLSTVLPAKRISVMYFDEAHELDSQFWVFLRLVKHQLLSTKMWYTFMGTKSNVSYYAPRPNNQLSLRLKDEMNRLLMPYIDLGFDHRVIAARGMRVSIRMRKMQTIEFISQYGRPMWGAHLPEQTPGDIIGLASWKLRNGDEFRATNKDHVFAVLSQRLCLDPVIALSEAIGLADRSVAHHMRLLTGFSTNCDRFDTHSPSEPILVMGSVDILYNTSQLGRLGDVLNTLSKDLCGAGLVEKGVLGELGARILILIARDFAAPRNSRGSRGRNLLEPVPLLLFLDTLFGRNIFTDSDKSKFDKAFGIAHVNFTHWIGTRDSIPEKPNQQLLANLWARGAALQCCFSQESIDFLIPSYHGSINPDSEFDPSQLSAVLGRVKNKVAGDEKAELAIRPIGIPRDHHQPLPYLAILMELGNESCYIDNGLKIKYTASEPPADGEFGELCAARDVAEKKLEDYRWENKTKKDVIEELKKTRNEARLAVDFCNRYSISVRGVSREVYGILRTADIANEFATLLDIIMPLPVSAHSTRKYMRPLERLSGHHVDWMSEYVVSNQDGDAL